MQPHSSRLLILFRINEIQGAILVSSHKRDFGAELGALGYPGFSYLRSRRRRNPAEVLQEALNEPNLDARVAEGLPWLAMTYVDWTGIGWFATPRYMTGKTD